MPYQSKTVRFESHELHSRPGSARESLVRDTSPVPCNFYNALNSIRIGPRFGPRWVPGSPRVSRRAGGPGGGRGTGGGRGLQRGRESLEVARKFAAEAGMLEPIFYCRLQVAELAAAVVALALEFECIH